MLKGKTWVKITGAVASGGMAVAMFGGAAVHTQFSASSPQTLAADGATVAVVVESGNITCSNLLPGATIPCNWENPIDINNTGTVPEDLSITLGTISVTNGGVDGDVLHNLDQALIWAGWGAGAVLGTGNQFSGPGYGPGYQAVPLTTFYTEGTGVPLSPATYAIGSALPAGASDHGGMTLSLMPGPVPAGDDANAWNGAIVTIPYTITATAGV
jgi:hypothetical protein